jgi:Flp pilus assembly protein TadG
MSALVTEPCATTHPAGGRRVGRMSDTAAPVPTGHSGGPSRQQEPQPPVHLTSTSIRARRRHREVRGPEAGQSLVEFSLIFLPLFVILMGIIQFGFVFGTYVTMTNAARDAARLGTIYTYDASLSKAQNDLLRNETIRAALKGSMNVLGKSSPYFSNSSTWTQSGLTFTNGDLVITYAIPSGVLDTDSRVGQRITISATYHQDLVVPLVSNFLPKDAGGRLSLSGVATMVVN